MHLDWQSQIYALQNRSRTEYIRPPVQSGRRGVQGSAPDLLAPVAFLLPTQQDDATSDAILRTAILVDDAPR